MAVFHHLSHVPGQAKGFIPNYAMPHILVVDDNEGITEAFSLFLECYGYRVSTANDGPSALEISHKEAIDALITDFRMPGMNGNELVALLRTDHPDLPAVIVSGYTWEISPLDFKTKILPKPVEMTKLMGIVEELLVEA